MLCLMLSAPSAGISRRKEKFWIPAGCIPFSDIFKSLILITPGCII